MEVRAATGWGVGAAVGCSVSRFAAIVGAATGTGTCVVGASVGGSVAAKVGAVMFASWGRSGCSNFAARGIVGLCVGTEDVAAVIGGEVITEVLVGANAAKRRVGATVARMDTLNVGATDGADVEEDVSSTAFKSKMGSNWSGPRMATTIRKIKP